MTSSSRHFPALVAAITFISVFVIGLCVMVDEHEDKQMLERDHVHQLGHAYLSAVEREVNLLASLPQILHAEFKLHGPAQFSASFQTLAQNLNENVMDDDVIISLAPAGSISQVYPQQPGQALLGQDLLKGSESNVIKRAMQDRQSVLSKSWSLIAGKQMLVVHYPVYSDADDRFWGILSVMLQLDSVFKQSTYSQFNQHEHLIQVVRADDTGAEQLFYQSEGPEDTSYSVSHYLNLPDGDWMLRTSVKGAGMISPAWLGWSTLIALLLAWTAYKFTMQPQLLKAQVMERTSQLAAHDRFLNQLISSLPVGIAVSDSQANLRYSNPLFNEIMDADVKEGDSLFNLLEAALDSANMRQFLISRISLNEVNFDVMVRISERDFQLTCSHIASVQGKLLVWVFRDVTSISEINRTLRNVSATRADMLRLIPDPIAFFNKKGELIESNPSFQELFVNIIDIEAGFYCSEFEQKLTLSTLSESTLRPVCMLKQPKQQESYIDEYVMPGPPPRVFERTVCFANSSNTVGSIMHFRDVTAANEVDRMKTEFLSTAAHELRTPLANIFGYTELLLKAQFDKPRQDEMLSVIHNQTRRLSSILDDLLDLARIEARAGEAFNFDWHDLNQILQDVSKELEFDLQSHSFDQSVAAGVGEIWCDGDKIEQVIENLLSNAVKYSPDNTVIRLNCESRRRADEDGYLIRVADQGIGMSQNDLDHVFDRFYRADTSGQVPGTGLGMAIVREIINHHRGHITIDSEPGQGTTVTIWLPRQRREGDVLVDGCCQSA